MKHKKLFVAAVAIFSLIVFLAIFIVIWFWGDTYSDMADFNSGVEIPGLEEGAVPQGMTNYTYVGSDQAITKQEYFFISAYMKNGPSRLYVSGARTGYVGYVTLKNEDGTDYFGHAGGIANSCNNSDTDGDKRVSTRVTNGTFWLTSDGTVFCMKSSSEYSSKYNIAEEIILKAALEEGDKSVQFTSSFKANNEASFCYFYDDGTSSTLNDKLYVGEFYRKGNYETADNHRITTQNGIAQRAFVYEYTSNTNSTNKYGLTVISDTNVPENNRVPKIQNIYSVPDKIQGFARTSSGDLVLSQSYGLPNSHLYYYKWSIGEEQDKKNYPMGAITDTSNRTLYSSLMQNKYGKAQNFAYEGVYYEQHGNQEPVQYTDSSLYVYFIDETKLVRDYSVPSMSEGLCTSGDKVHVLFESACYKYKPFVRQPLKNVKTFVPRSL